MKIQSIDNISTKGLPARKLTARYVNLSAKKAIIKPIRPELQSTEEKCVIKQIRKELPKSYTKDETIIVAPETQKRVSACGYMSDSCGGGFDFCGAYM